jgi:hypothetical protein
MPALAIRTITSVWFIMLGFGTSRTEILKGCLCQTTARIISFKAVKLDSAISKEASQKKKKKSHTVHGSKDMSLLSTVEFEGRL